MARKLSKRAQETLDQEQEAKLQAFEAFQDIYNGKEFDAKICWFDATSGEGVIQLDNGQSFYLHYSSIEGVDKNGYAYPAEKDLPLLRTLDGRACTVVPYISYGMGGMIEKCVLKQGEEHV